MSNPNYDNVILGSGIAGLTIFYYLAESTKTRNLLLTNNIANQTSTPFPLGPRFLHQNKDTEALLRRLGFSIKTREIFIGYKKDDDIRNFPTDEFKAEYVLKSRGTSKVESSFLSGGGRTGFTAYTVSQVALGTSLLNKSLGLAKSDRNEILIANIKSIAHKKVVTDKETFYGDNIISTIPLNALTKMLSNSSMTVKISSKPDEMNFFLVNEKGRGQFDYIYSVSDPWHRKTYVPELDKWVYETKSPEPFMAIYGEWVAGRVKIASQISSSLNIKELGNIKLVGRYAQMNHSIKTEDIIHWAHNYTRKFNGKKMKNGHECKLFSEECDTIEIYPPINLEKGGWVKDENDVILADKTKPKIKVRHCIDCGVILL